MIIKDLTQESGISLTVEQHAKFNALVKSLPPNWGAHISLDNQTGQVLLCAIQAPMLRATPKDMEILSKNPEKLASLTVFWMPLTPTAFDDMAARIVRLQKNMDHLSQMLEQVLGIPVKDIAQALFADNQLILSWMPKTERISLGLVMGDLDPMEKAAPFGFEWSVGQIEETGQMRVGCRPIVCMTEEDNHWTILDNRPWSLALVDPDAPGDFGLVNAVVVATSKAFDSAVDVATKTAAAVKSLRATKFGMLVDRMTEQKRQEMRGRN